jgi:hypothetical protein
MKQLFIILPSLLVGGVLFGSSFSHADVGHSGNDWQRTVVVAQADPRPAPRVPRVPPVPRVPAVPPVPPVPPPHAGSGINVQIHGGKLQLDGVDEIVDSSIRSAIDSIKSSNLPNEVKTKLIKRMEKVSGTVKNRLAHLDANNLDQLGDELGKMGDEIGKEMDEFGKEMEKFGEKMGKDALKKAKKDLKFKFRNSDDDGDNDSDDDADLPSAPDVDVQDDADDTVRQLGDLSLKGPQREQIRRLRADSDRQVEMAQRQLGQAEEMLKRALDNAATSDAEISRAIDAVTQQEAQIRKARILAWHGARRVLDEAQRQKIESAARAHHH